MGSQPSRGPVMTRINWWLVDTLSRLLEPGERDAVRGDLAESGETAGQALRDVFGLVARRQAVLWKDWRLWLALLVVPFGLPLGLISARTADHSVIYIWLYANNWDWAFLANSGFRHDLVHFGAGILMSYVTLLCWSWTSGFLLGSLSRGAIQVNGALFCIVLLSAEPAGAPHARNFGLNAAVFAVTFYRMIFPLIVQAALVLLPSLWGMRQGLRLFKENNT
jgi:hypothetical protein